MAVFVLYKKSVADADDRQYCKVNKKEKQY
jgi:hypothetical protein